MKQLIQCMGMLMLLFGLSSRVSAQITLVKDGKATSRIVLVEKNEVNEQAATLLHRFVHRRKVCPHDERRHRGGQRSR